MTRICGVELKASDAIVSLVTIVDGQAEHIELPTKKIKIDDDESIESIKSFFDAFCNFINANEIELIVIKKRMKKGQFAGGPISFKLEALIQLNGTIDVKLLSSQAIAAADKKEAIELPENILRYQIDAYKAAVCWARNNT
jgi:ATP sulfurylase